MRTAFIEALCELAAREERIWLVNGDLGFSVLERFVERFPGRYVNAGVAEQNMMGLAAGLASAGRIVFTYSIANFAFMRCLEQVRNDVCHHGFNVKVVAVGGGFTYGAHGYTHHATEDLAIMRALPNMTVVAPADPWEAAEATTAVARRPGPCYLRLGRAGEPPVHTDRPAFQIGRAIRVRDGRDVTLVSTGGMLKTTLEAADQLAARGVEARVLSMHTLAPLDEEALGRCARETGWLATIEEHSPVGGLHGAVAQSLAAEGVPVLRFAIDPATSAMVGSQEYLRRVSGLTSTNIFEKVFQALPDMRRRAVGRDPAGRGSG